TTTNIKNQAAGNVEGDVGFRFSSCGSASPPTEKIPVAEGVTCSVTELSPCLAAFMSSSPPSASCCAKLREQKPCLCGYMRNPSLRQYVSSPNAKKSPTVARLLPKTVNHE
ncbi:hypothetical protein Bca52824_095938, partial [Brassica carinata]